MMKQSEEITILPSSAPNRVASVDGVIVKVFGDSLTRNKEFVGNQLFNGLSGFSAPILVEQGANFTVMEDLSQSLSLEESGLSREEIAVQTADLLVRIFERSAKLGRRLRVFPDLTFGLRLEQLLEEVTSSSQMRNLLGSSRKQIIREMRKIRTVDLSARITVLHRDLHVRNLLLDPEGETRVIDFEHVMIGPIEFELQNSIFWDDDASLPVDLIRDELVDRIGYDIKLEQQLAIIYFMDQLSLAIKQNDMQKAELVVDTFKRKKKQNGKSI